MMDPEDLVSVCTVTSPTEAEIIRNALQSVGIACEIGGWSQAGLAGVLEISVLAHANEVKEARKYLRKLRREKIERRRKHVAARKARAEPPDVSQAIQEVPPRKSSPDIKE